MISRRTVALALGLGVFLAGVRWMQADTLSTRLCQASYRGDAAAVDRLLQQGADPNGTTLNWHFWRGLNLRRGDRRCFDCYPKRCAPPLSQAVKGCHSEVARLLLERGASFDDRERDRMLRYAQHVLDDPWWRYTAKERQGAARVVRLLKRRLAISE